MKIREEGGSSNLVTAQVPASSVPTTDTWVQFTFPSVSLSTGVNYFIWLESDNFQERYRTYASIATTANAPQGPTTFDGITTVRVDVTVGGPSFNTNSAHDVPFTLVPEFSEAAIPALLAVGVLGLARRLRRRAVI